MRSGGLGSRGGRLPGEGVSKTKAAVMDLSELMGERGVLTDAVQERGFGEYLRLKRGDVIGIE